jgi:integrase
MASIYKIASGWRAQVRIAGKTPQSQVFRTKVEAVSWARSIEGSLHKNNTDHHLVPYADIQHIYITNTKNPGYTKVNVLKKLLEYWDGYRIGEITSQSVSEYILKRQRDGLAPPTILSELTYFGVVIQHGGILSGNEDAPRARAALAAAIKTHRTLGTVGDSAERTRRPSTDELTRLEEFFFYRPRSQTPVWDCILIAMTTAMRLGEICGPGGVVWEDLDESRRLLTIRSRKDPVIRGGRDDIIPLLKGPVVVHGQVIDPVEVLLRQKTARQRRGRIFPFSENTVSQAFTIACKKLGIVDLHFHDLRHEAISRLFEHGYSIPEVAKVSGHKSWKHLQRYTQIRPETLHDRNKS